MTLPSAHVGVAVAPLELLPLAIAAWLYWRRAGALRASGRPTPEWRQACFYSGLLLIVASLASPLGHLSEELFSAHMGEHLLIGDLAPLLIVLGLTGPLLAPLLRIRGLGGLRALAHPAVALPLWAANLYLWHLPVLYEEAYAGAPVHALEHTAFIFFGCLMWMPVFGPLPKPAWFTNAWKLGYVIVVRFTGAVLANVFMWSSSAYYTVFEGGEAEWNISPLADQSTAGVLMMVEGSLVTLGVFAWLFFRTAAEGSERQRLIEVAEAHGITLEEARAARAAAAGQGRRLEERLTTPGRRAE
jgi:cytochrome c oxidase assembly factor CtaG